MSRLYFESKCKIICCSRLLSTSLSLLILIELIQIQSSSSLSLASPKSPWKPALWKVTFNIGREAGSWMPEEWGASGARCVFDVTVNVTSDAVQTYTNKNNNNNNDDVDQGPSLSTRDANQLFVISDGSFVSSQGQQTVTFAQNSNGWKLRMPTTKGHATRLQCHFDLQSTLTRNDVTLEKGTRLYCLAKCWREDDYEIALRKVKPLQEAYQRAQRNLDAVLNHETGDRRLDGTNIIDTVQGMTDTAALVLQRDIALDELNQAYRVYPKSMVNKDYINQNDNDNDDTLLESGPWPGQIEWMTMEPQTIVIKKKGSLFSPEEFHIVGSWSLTPILSEDEFEYDDGNDGITAKLF